MRLSVSLCLTEHQAVKTANAWLRIFLILSSVGLKLLAPCSGRLISGKISRYPLGGRLGGTRNKSGPW
jgi:hypothetical protein